MKISPGKTGVWRCEVPGVGVQGRKGDSVAVEVDGRGEDGWLERRRTRYCERLNLADEFDIEVLTVVGLLSMMAVSAVAVTGGCTTGSESGAVSLGGCRVGARSTPSLVPGSSTGGSACTK